jgi:hypothetical protein
MAWRQVITRYESKDLTSHNDVKGQGRDIHCVLGVSNGVLPVSEGSEEFSEGVMTS